MVAKDVDIALSAPAEEVGPALLGLKEDQWFERKSIRIKANDLATDLVAFANAEGGTVVVGLHGGKVEGLRSHADKLNAIRQAPIDFTAPPVRASFKQLRCLNGNGDQDTLLVIRVEPGERVHELRNGDCYLRIGDESRKLSFPLRRELEYDRGQSQFDGEQAAGVAYRDLDRGLLGHYVQATGAKSNAKHLLAARSLLTRTGEVTNAGYLLFGRHPQDVFPEAYIRVLKFLSPIRGTGARLGLEEEGDIRIEGPITRAIQEAQAKIEELIPKRRHLVETGAFEARPIVPRDAWLEGLVNAVIHRSYSLAGDHVRVEIYPDRVEVESPGRFPGIANPADPLTISRYARNPRIARVCADLRIGQELGEGIKRIFEEMRAVGLTDPVYRQSQASVRLSLAAIPRLPPRVAARLPRGSQRVLDIMRGAGRPLSTGDIAEILDISRRPTIERLKALESEGLIRWIGKSTRDPRAVWVLEEPS